MCIIIRNTQKTIFIDKKKIENAVELILHHLKLQNWSVSVWFTTNPTIRKLNNYYRKIDKPTDILSIPTQNLKPGERPKPLITGEKELGDLIISLQYVAKYCTKNNVSLKSRIPVLLVHGVCHLLGYDHMTEKQYKQMHKKEQALLSKLPTTKK